MATKTKTKTANQEVKKPDVSNFKEVKTVYSDSECNQLIGAGWVIMHGGVSHIDNFGLNTKPTFIMGKLG